jgi:hypothetical protein
LATASVGVFPTLAPPFFLPLPLSLASQTLDPDLASSASPGAEPPRTHARLVSGARSCGRTLRLGWGRPRFTIPRVVGPFSVDGPAA